MMRKRKWIACQEPEGRSNTASRNYAPQNMLKHVRTKKRSRIFTFGSHDVG